MEQSFTVGKEFCVFRKIGSGSFGNLYEGMDKKTGKRVAIKFESIDSKQRLLYNEYELYKKLQGMDGIPEVYFYGEMSKSCDVNGNVLVMELLSTDIRQVFIENGCSFKFDTIAYIAYHAVSGLERIHECGIIHRDVKPENFMLGTGSESDIIYAIDFRQAKRYRDPVSNKHILALHTGKGLIGTARYASIWAHSGFEQSRRDDLESLAYMLVFLVRGTLPWQLKPAVTYKQMLEKKPTTSTRELCQGCPKQLQVFLDNVKRLSFQSDPPYQYYRILFYEIWKENRPLIGNVNIKMQTDLIRVLPDRFAYESMLYATSRIGNLAVVVCLLSHGTKINDVFSEKRTCLWIASKHGHLAVVKYLLLKDANVHSKDIGDRSCLWIACSKGHLQVVEYLISRGANVHDKDSNNLSCLFIASMNGHIDVIKLILSNGASTNDRSNDGKTCLDVAKTQECKEILKNWESTMFLIVLQELGIGINSIPVLDFSHFK